MRMVYRSFLILGVIFFSVGCSLDASILTIEKLVPGPRYAGSEFVAGSTLNEKTSGDQGAGRYIVLSSSGSWSKGNLAVKTSRGYSVYHGVIGQVIFEESPK